MSPHKATAEEITNILQREFTPSRFELIDESHLHAGHAGARAGGGHFRLEISSARFTGKSPLERQRMVYQALGDLMEKRIHALSMRCSVD
jgi:BolA protein